MSISAFGLGLTLPSFFKQTKTEAFREWIDRKIKEGEKINDLPLIDEIVKKPSDDNELESIQKVEPFDRIFNRWHVKRERILRRAFGKDSAFTVLDPDTDMRIAKYINGPTVWGGARKLLRAEIQHLKWLKNMVTTSEYFDKDFNVDVIREIEKDNPLGT